MKLSSLVKKIHAFVNPPQNDDAESEISKLSNLLDKEENLILGLFDKDWYYNSYPDVKDEGISAAEHYLRF